MTRYVMGDPHGRKEALLQVLIACKFDYENDELVCLGDICDGGPNTMGVVEILLKIKHLVLVLGNHDRWFLKHIASGWDGENWVQQGGAVTLESYGAKVKLAEYILDDSEIDTSKLIIPVTHQEFFNRGKYYHIVDDMIFVHGGFDPRIPIKDNSNATLCWDRQLIDYARGHNVEGYDKVFVGHSTTLRNGSALPDHRSNLWMLDTGAGHCGRLTIMNTDTEQYWQSDIQPSCHR